MKIEFIRILVILSVLGLSASPAPSLKGDASGIQAGTGQRQGKISISGEGLGLNLYHLGWARTFGPFFPDLSPGYTEDGGCSAIQLTAAGGAILAGNAGYYSSDFKDQVDQALLLAISGSGQVSWDILFKPDIYINGYNQFNALVRTADGNYVAAGQAGTHQSVQLHALAMKVTPDGRALWARMFGFSVQLPGVIETAGVAVETPDGGCILAGTYNTMDAWLIKLDAEGQLLWHRDLEVGSHINVSRMRSTPDGGFVIAGDGSEGTEVIRCTSGGRVLWHRTYAEDPARGLYDTSPCNIVPLADGGYFLAGTSQDESSALCADCSAVTVDWVCRLDGSGNITWQKGLAGFDLSMAFPAPDGGYIVTGPTLALKLTAEGAIQWQKNMGLVLGPSLLTNDGRLATAFDCYSCGSAYFPLMGFLYLDANGAIGPGCTLAGDSTAAAVRDSSLQVRATTRLNYFQNSIWMQTLDPTFHSRPCEVKTLCASAPPPRY